MTLPAPLADPQLLRLEQLLGDPALAQAMRLDEAHGYLCAALSGPRPLAEEQWLSEVLGSTDSEANDILREAASLLRIFVSELETGLARGEPPVLLLYPVEGREDGAGDYVPWCQAYLHGVDAAAEDWFDALGAEDGKEDSEEICYLDEQLFPLFMLTGATTRRQELVEVDFHPGQEHQERQSNVLHKDKNGRLGDQPQHRGTDQNTRYDLANHHRHAAKTRQQDGNDKRKQKDDDQRKKPIRVFGSEQGEIHCTILSNVTASDKSAS